MKRNTPNFVIPEYIADGVGNSAYKVEAVDVKSGLVVTKVYDPLDVTDEPHGAHRTFTLDGANALTAVTLQPQLFKAAR